jgi:hypothetical protein
MATKNIPLEGKASSAPLVGSGIFFGPRFIKPITEKQLQKTQEVKVEERKTRIDDLFDFEIED